MRYYFFAITIVWFSLLTNAQSVDHVSGELQYSPTILDVPGPGLSFPINLSYASGIQPGQEASWIGLGWDFHPGAIVRTVNNIPDDFDGKSNYNGKPNQQIITSSHIDWSLQHINDQRQELLDYWKTKEWWNKRTEHIIKYSHNHFRKKWNTRMVINDRTDLNNQFPPPPENSDEEYKNTLTLTRGWGVLNYRDFYDRGFTLSNGAHTNTIDSDNTYTINYSMDVQSTQFHEEIDLVGENDLSNGYVPSFDSYIVTQPKIAGEIKPNLFGLFSMLGAKQGEDDSNFIVGDYYKQNHDHSFSAKIYESQFRYKNAISNSAKIDVDISDLNNTALDYDNSYSEINTGNIYDKRRIKYFTNEEIENIENGSGNTAGLMIHPYELSNTAKISTEESRTLLSLNIENYFEFNQNVQNDRSEDGGYESLGSITSFDVSDQIGGFLITDEQGYNYHFTLPVYEYGVFTRQRIPMNKYEFGDYVHSFSKRDHPAAYRWELYAITGPDFVDVNGNHRPDDGDIGNWVRFDYGLWTRDYKFRTPAEGYSSFEFERTNLIESDIQHGTVSIGKREKYYLNTVVTPTHTALFVKEQRIDNKSLSVYKSYDVQPYSNFGFVYEDIYNAQLPDKTDRRAAYHYLPYFQKGSNHPNATSATPGVANTSSWPVSVCGLKEILLFRNENLDNLLVDKGFTDSNGSPDISKLYQRSKLANEVVAIRPMGTKNVTHLGGEILDNYDIDGLGSSLSFMNPNNVQVQINQSEISAIPNFRSAAAYNVKLNHDYSLAPNSVNSFEVDYNHFTARDVYNTSGKYFDHSSYTPHSSNTTAQIMYSLNSDAEDEKKGKYTLKSIETFNKDQDRINKIGDFHYDFDFINRDANGQILNYLNNGDWDYLIDNKYQITNIQDASSLEVGDILKIPGAPTNIGLQFRRPFFLIESITGNTAIVSFVGTEVEDLGNQSPYFVFPANYSFTKSYNPPSNPRQVDEFGDYKPDIEIFYTTHDSPLFYRVPSDNSAKNKDAWSLRGIEHSDGSATIIEYESNTLDRSILESGNFITLNNAQVINGSSGKYVEVNLPAGFNCSEVFSSQGMRTDVMTILGYEHSNSSPCNGQSVSGNIEYEKIRFLVEDVEFKKLQVQVDCNANKLIISAPVLWKTLENYYLSPSSDSKGNVSFHPNPVTDGFCENGDPGTLVYENPPTLLSISIKYERVDAFYGPGIRVKSITKIDGDRKVSKEYNYVKEDGSSSGEIFGVPAIYSNMIYNSSALNSLGSSSYLRSYYKQKLSSALSRLTYSSQYYNSFSQLIQDAGHIYTRVEERELNNDIGNNFTNVYEFLGYKEEFDFIRNYNEVVDDNGPDTEKSSMVHFISCLQAGLQKRTSTYHFDNLYSSTEFKYSHELSNSPKSYLDTLHQKYDDIGVYEEAYFTRKKVESENFGHNSCIKITKCSPLLIGMVKHDYKRKFHDIERHLEFDLLTGTPTKSVTKSNRGKFTVSETVKALDLQTQSNTDLYPEFGPGSNSWDQNLLSYIGFSRLYFATKNGASYNKTQDIGLSYYTYHKPTKYTNENGIEQNLPNNASIFKPFNIHKPVIEFSNIGQSNTNGTFSFGAIQFPVSQNSIETYNWGQSSIKPTIYDKYFRILESTNSTEQNYDSKRFGYNQEMIICEADNSMFSEMTYCGAENQSKSNSLYLDGGVKLGDGVITSSYSHTGSQGLYLTKGQTGFIFETTFNRPNEFLVSVWVRNSESNTPKINVKIGNPVIQQLNGGQVVSSSGEWELLHFTFEYDGNGDEIEVSITNTNTSLPITLDDFRIHPISSNMKSYVYDKISGDISYTLNTRNFYTRIHEQHFQKHKIQQTYFETIHGEKLMSENKTQLKEFDR